MIFLHWSIIWSVSNDLDFSSHLSGVVTHTTMYLRTFFPRFTTTSRQPQPLLATCFLRSNTTFTAESNIGLKFLQRKWRIWCKKEAKKCFVHLGITPFATGITLVSPFCLIVSYWWCLLQMSHCEVKHLHSPNFTIFKSLDYQQIYASKKRWYTKKKVVDTLRIYHFSFLRLFRVCTNFSSLIGFRDSAGIRTLDPRLRRALL